MHGVSPKHLRRTTTLGLVHENAHARPAWCRRRWRGCSGHIISGSSACASMTSGTGIDTRVSTGTNKCCASEPARKGDVRRLHARAPIHDEEYQICFADRLRSLLVHLASESTTLVRLLQTARIYDGEIESSEPAHAFLAIARRACAAVHDGSAGSRQAVEERGLANIGSPYQSYLDARRRCR